jgi:hypothetical protein
VDSKGENMKPDMKQQAKMKMLQDLKKMATGMMGEDLKGKMDGMKKVSVMANDKDGLEKGLDKAKEMMHGMPEMDKMAHEEASDTGSEDMETDHLENEDEEMGEEECSPEELQMKIKELQAKLDALKK